MERFDDEGTFWYPGDKSERRVVGRLAFEPAEGLTLEIIAGGQLVDLVELINSTGNEKYLIHGATGKGDVTLIRCTYRGNSIGSNGIARTTYGVQVAVFGSLIEEDDPTFSEVIVRYDQLSNWVGRTGIESRYVGRKEDPDGRPSGLVIEYNEPQDDMVSAESYDLTLRFNWSLRTDRLTNASVQQDTEIGVEYREPRALWDVLNDLYKVQNFVTLAVDAPTVPTKITVYREDSVLQVGPEETVPKPLSLFVGNTVERVKEAHPQSERDVLFRFDQVGGVSTMSRWIEISEKYRPVLGLLLSLRYSATLYEENRYTNAISAAETLHRLMFVNEVMPRADYKSYRRKLVKAVKKLVGVSSSKWLQQRLEYANEPRLRDRLIDLAKYAGLTFGLLVEDIESWATAVSGMRNRLTHHDANSGLVRQPGDAFFMAESIYVLVMLCLLLECQVESEALQNIRVAPRIDFLAVSLSEIIPRIAASLRPNRRNSNPDVETSGDSGSTD